MFQIKPRNVRTKPRIEPAFALRHVKPYDSLALESAKVLTEHFLKRAGSGRSGKVGLSPRETRAAEILLAKMNKCWGRWPLNNAVPAAEMLGRVIVQQRGEFLADAARNYAGGRKGAERAMMNCIKNYAGAAELAGLSRLWAGQRIHGIVFGLKGLDVTRKREIVEAIHEKFPKLGVVREGG